MLLSCLLLLLASLRVIVAPLPIRRAWERWEVLLILNLKVAAASVQLRLMQVGQVCIGRVAKGA
jgi:hypothetical protein